MGLLSFFKRGDNTPAATAADAAGEARTRARRRLIGATVLVVLGIVGFPLLFETQPRPIPVDVQIEIPRKESAAPLTSPRTAAKTGAASTASAGRASAPPEPAIITETRAEAGREVPAPQEPVSASKPASKADAKVAESKVAEVKPGARSDGKPAESTKPADAKTPSKADPPKPKAADKPTEKPADKVAAAPAATDGLRVAVQIGAYSDENTAREMRLKVEKLGYKVYTQSVKTDSGPRIRVRVGPFATRDEADKVAGRIKSSGLPAAVVTL